MSKGYRLDYLEFPVSAELDKDTLAGSLPGQYRHAC